MTFVDYFWLAVCWCYWLFWLFGFWFYYRFWALNTSLNALDEFICAFAFVVDFGSFELFWYWKEFLFCRPFKLDGFELLLLLWGLFCLFFWDVWDGEICPSLSSFVNSFVFDFDALIRCPPAEWRPSRDPFWDPFGPAFKIVFLDASGFALYSAAVLV